MLITIFFVDKVRFFGWASQVSPFSDHDLSKIGLDYLRQANSICINVVEHSCMYIHIFIGVYYLYIRKHMHKDMWVFAYLWVWVCVSLRSCVRRRELRHRHVCKRNTLDRNISNHTFLQTANSKYGVEMCPFESLDGFKNWPSGLLSVSKDLNEKDEPIEHDKRLYPLKVTAFYHFLKLRLLMLSGILSHFTQKKKMIIIK